MADGPAQIEVQDARLHPRDPVGHVDVDDPVQMCRHDDDRSLDGRGATGQTGAAPPRDERPVVACDDPHRGRDIRPGRREAHDRGLTPLDARVAAVQGQLEGFGARTVRAEGGSEVSEECAVVVDNRSLPTRCRYARCRPEGAIQGAT